MTGFHVEIQRGCSGFFGYSSTPRWRLMKEKDSCHQKEAVIISHCSVFNTTSVFGSVLGDKVLSSIDPVLTAQPFKDELN